MSLGGECVSYGIVSHAQTKNNRIKTTGWESRGTIIPLTILLPLQGLVQERERETAFLVADLE